MIAQFQRRAMMVVIGTVLVGLAVSPTKAFANATGGRLGGIVWPIQPTQVAHYAAVLVGMTVVLWLAGVSRSRWTGFVIAGAFGVLDPHHSRIALVAMLAGILAGGLSLLLSRKRVRRAFVVTILVVGVGALSFAPVITRWFERARGRRARCATPASAFFRAPALPLVPVLDRASRHWLERSRSPYMAEIAQIAETLDFSGVWLLNASYQWGCTARAAEQDGVPWLIRTLDWPFLGLGRYADVAHMRGGCGDFFSVTWPGYVGALTAMAPRALRLASIRRRCADAPRIAGFAPTILPPMRSRSGNRDDLMPPDQLLAPDLRDLRAILPRRGVCWKRRRWRDR